ncbi:MAG: hypothetical protein ACRDKB_11650 [Actinomycetota bacterium]
MRILNAFEEDLFRIARCLQNHGAFRDFRRRNAVLGGGFLAAPVTLVGLIRNRDEPQDPRVR